MFTANSCLGKLALDKKVSYPLLGELDQHISLSGNAGSATFNHPSALCYAPHLEAVLVVEGNGRYISKINLQDDLFCQAFIPEDIAPRVNSMVNPYASIGLMSICAMPDRVCWSNSSVNKVLDYHKGSIRSIGNGKRGYAMASFEEYSSLDGPSGLAFYDKAIMISEKNNHCVRSFAGSSKLVAGHPVSSEYANFYPEKLLFTKEGLFLIDGKKISQMLNNKITIVYDENSLVLNMVAAWPKHIIILEGKDA